jgi:hypothetical protein
MNNPAIPMSAARAVFFLAHANEKQPIGGQTARRLGMNLFVSKPEA